MKSTYKILAVVLFLCMLAVFPSCEKQDLPDNPNGSSAYSNSGAGNDVFKTSSGSDQQDDNDGNVKVGRGDGDDEDDDNDIRIGGGDEDDDVDND